MRNTDRESQSTNQVIALYADRILSLSLSQDATFAELADRLDPSHIDRCSDGMPTAIYLRFAKTRHRGATRSASMWLGQRQSLGGWL